MSEAILFDVQLQPVVNSVFYFLLRGGLKLAQDNHQVVGGLGDAGGLDGLGLLLAVFAFI